MEFLRYRQSGNITKTVPTFRTKESTPGSVWTSYGTSQPRFGDLRTISDNVTPKYWARKKAGEYMGVNRLRTNKKTVEVQGSSHFTQHWPAVPGYYTEWEGRFSPNVAYTIMGLNPSTTVMGYDRTRLVTEVLTKVFADRQKGDANYVESLAELDQVWEMIRHPAANVSRFAETFAKQSSYRRLEELRRKYPQRRRNSPVTVDDYVDVVRRGVIVRRKRIRKTVRDWLEMNRLWTSEYLRFRYGIKPLMEDIKVGIKNAQDVYNRVAQPTFHTSRASGRVDRHEVVQTVFASANQTNTWSRKDLTIFSVRANWTDEYQGTVFNKLGLSFHNVVAVPWELTRLSFVVDWFANVGDLIYANIPRLGVTPKGGSYTMRLQIQNEVYQSGMVNNPGATIIQSGMASDKTIVTWDDKERFEIERSNATGLVIKSDFRFNNWTRCADAIALSLEQLRKIRL